MHRSRRQSFPAKSVSYATLLFQCEFPQILGLPLQGVVSKGALPHLPAHEAQKGLLLLIRRGTTEAVYRSP